MIAFESHWENGCVTQVVAGTPWTSPISVGPKRRLPTGKRGALWWCLDAATDGPCDLCPCLVTVKALHSR